MPRDDQGSHNIDDNDRPRWNKHTKVIDEYDYYRGDGSYSFTKRRGENPDGEKVFTTTRKNMLGFDERWEDPSGEDTSKEYLPGLGDEKPVPYRLPGLIAVQSDELVLICEGEKDVDIACSLGFVATCNPDGALKWRDEFSPHLAGRNVVIIPDNDERGREHARKVAASVRVVAGSLKVVELPGLPQKGDLSDWVQARREDGGTDETISDELRELIAVAVQPWWVEAVTLDLADPMSIGRHFFAAEFPEVDGAVTLRFWHGEWYGWTGPCWRPVEEREIQSRVYHWLEKQRTSVNGETKRVKPRRALVNEVATAVQVQVLVPGEVEAPAWIEERPGDWSATEMVSVENGLLHLPTATLRKHTPRLFAINSIQAHWNAEAWADKTEPTHFLGFLGEVITVDGEAQVALLQEMFGYMLTPDTKHQTAFMLIGPKRSGKGTISRILQKLHAKDYVSPSVSALAGRFGKQSLIGKTIAVMTDVRLSSRMDHGAFAETILSITGEDPQTVERKGITDWIGYLRTRFLIMANSLPRFHDRDSVLASRFNYIVTDVSHFEKEDLTLGERLLGEIDLILIWAVQGWQRLEKNRRFTKSETHGRWLARAETIMRPFKAFIDECCIVDAEAVETTENLYRAFEAFCEENEVGHFDRNSFAGKLHSEMPSLKSHRPRHEGGRVHCKKGLALKPEWRSEEPM